jgi:asparagine synthase (glutamine-hydrolysing)
MSGWFRRIPAFARERVIRPLIEALPERQDGHYTVNHLKRFVRSSSLSPAHCYHGFLNRINPAIRESFFAEPERFAAHHTSCQDLVAGYFNSQNVNGSQGSLNRVLYSDIKTYLPEDILAVTDRMSMQHALEVRVPFLDHKFMEFCATIPPELKIKWLNKKYLLKKAVGDLVPHEVINHRKQGFVGPMTSWLKNDLKDYVFDTLSDEGLRRHNLLNRSTVRRVLDEHFSGREIHDTLIWSMLIFQSWHDLYIHNSKGSAS